jgi:uncharacterized protein YbjT (DUF2867 family)
MIRRHDAIPGRPFLVAGATGVIGREVVQSLLARGASVRAFVRRPETMAVLPESVERVVGCLEDREAVRRAFRGVQAAFFVSPHEDAEERIADNVLRACEQEGVRLVFAGLHADGANPVARLMRRIIWGVLLPHYRARTRIGERVRTSRTNPVILIPLNYYQNDDLCRDHILSGTYPLPLRLAPRVDTRDVGDAAARALVDSAIRSGAYWLVGPESLTGEQSAANWSRAVGRPVRYDPDCPCLGSWLEAHCGGRKALDFQKTYQFLAKVAIRTAPWQVKQTRFLLGRPPRTHAEYANDRAAEWGIRPNPIGRNL